MSVVEIAVAEGSFASMAALQQQFGNAARFRVGDVSTPAELAELTEGAHGLVVTLHRLSQAHIDALPDTVRVIGRAGVGLDSIDLRAAAERQIAVVFQPDYATSEVADHAVAMLLAAQRRIVQADNTLRSQSWAGGAELGPILALQDTTAGVIGAGRIGRAVIERLSPFVRRVLAFDLQAGATVPGVQFCPDLHGLLGSTQLITLHLPLNEQTHHLIGAAELAAMAPGSILVNVSRGGLVDEDAVARALHSGQLAGAALDVFETEPLPADSALRGAPNLVLSPHIAWYSSASGPRLANWTVADVVSFLNDGAPRFGRVVPVVSATSGVAAT